DIVVRAGPEAEFIVLRREDIVVRGGREPGGQVVGVNREEETHQEKGICLQAHKGSPSEGGPSRRDASGAARLPAPVWTQVHPEVYRLCDRIATFFLPWGPAAGYLETTRS